MNKVKVFLSYNRTTKLLFIEAFLLLAWARILKNRPFAKVVKSLGKQMSETSYQHNELNQKILKNISQAINITSKHTFWESQCLVQALAAMKMLNRREIDSTLYLGTSKDDRGKLIAHAWLRSGPFYLTGFEGMENFTVVGYFAKTFGEDIKGVPYENNTSN